MSETTTGATQGHRTNPVTTALLLVALFAVLAFSFVVAPRPDHPDEEAFGGTDAQVTAMLEDDGHEPWFSPIFEPGSGEIESGLFALQAALGAGVVGYALGNLRGRKAARDESAAEAPEAVD